MMILLLIVCSLLPMALGLALLVTAPPAEYEPSPAELTLSRPVVRPCSARVQRLAERAARTVSRLWVRPRRLRAPVGVVPADVTAAHRILAGRIPDIWASISDSHKPLPCR